MSSHLEKDEYEDEDEMESDNFDAVINKPVCAGSLPLPISPGKFST